MLDLLIQHDDSHATNSSNETPLMLASWFGTIQCVKLLLLHDCDIFTKDQRGKIVLDLAETDEIRKLLTNSESKRFVSMLPFNNNTYSLV